MLKQFQIDGSNIKSLDDFYDEISRVLIPNVFWGRNLDAFDDILGGGFGTPDEGFVIRWSNSAASRNGLGYSQTVRELEVRLNNCHPSNRSKVQSEIELAKQSLGPTAFDWLIDIIDDHPDIILRLE
ncbi:barstar family protein [Hyphococcus sp.]|uniref:barstar family protein n=1 Tax=Hyphococcus sp. TaxID=2038636 RepID=UPI0035C72036